MSFAMEKTYKRSGHRATIRILVVLLVICLAECATEQRINNRGSKASVVQKVNGWRSQRGGSCLSYGHSCWGAHGKRSNKSPISAPDWYFNRVLRRLAANAEMNFQNQDQALNSNDDTNAIYQYNVEDNVPGSNRLFTVSDEGPVELPLSRSLEAKPMLDDSLLPKYKIWQLMKGYNPKEDTFIQFDT
ncbi:uncharacterized protein LOC114240034 [Bombyx mandarina]|uniref:Uncharacterized protein LOC114240034 n=1 Tax=Bombyx mandarina TaxID=7092 RepID=A0A6J2J9X4_BOMMA|nr:uncharacterized protein LOC114240034 [Bombyx mandarina]